MVAMVAIEPVDAAALPQPPAGTPWDALSGPGRRAFLWLNRWLMIPIHRLGLAGWIATPLGGWHLLLEVRGRRTGLVRRVPLGYVIDDGSAWVLAGYGTRTQWYRNILAESRVTVHLPGRSFLATATEVRDPAVRARVIPQLIRSMGLAGAMAGCNPWSAPNARILECTAWVPLIRLHPLAGRLAAGPGDPGGLGWVARQLGICLAIAVLAAVARARGRQRV